MLSCDIREAIVRLVPRVVLVLSVDRSDKIAGEDEGEHGQSAVIQAEKVLMIMYIYSMSMFASIMKVYLSKEVEICRGGLLGLGGIFPWKRRKWVESVWVFGGDSAKVKFEVCLFGLLNL